MKIKTIKQFESYCKAKIFRTKAVDMIGQERTEASLFLAIVADASAGEIVNEGLVSKKYTSEASLIRYVVDYLSKEMVGFGTADQQTRSLVKHLFADARFDECNICTQMSYLLFRPYWVTGDYLDRFNAIMFFAQDESKDHKALLNQILLELMERGFDFDQARFIF